MGRPFSLRYASGKGRFGVVSGHPNPPCGEAVGRGTAPVGRGGGAATSRHCPSVSASRCHLPLASRQGGSYVSFRSFSAVPKRRSSTYRDRTSAEEGRSVSVRVDIGGRRIIK